MNNRKEDSHSFARKHFTEGLAILLTAVIMVGVSYLRSDVAKAQEVANAAKVENTKLDTHVKLIEQQMETLVAKATETTNNTTKISENVDKLTAIMASQGKDIEYSIKDRERIQKELDRLYEKIEE